MRQAPMQLLPVSGDPLHVVIGQRLKRLRRERGWSREAVASGMSVALNIIEEHERGERRFSPDELVAYAKFYGVPLSFFFRDV
jgi:transcriptional regulator with XRE-family HTH domain